MNTLAIEICKGDAFEYMGTIYTALDDPKAGADTISIYVADRTGGHTIVVPAETVVELKN